MRTVLGLAFILLAGCTLTPKPAVETKAAPVPAYATEPVWGGSLNGAIHYPGGLLMVSHATGSISVCWDKCRAIGKMEPTGVQDLVLSNDGHFGVYIANVATGHFLTCVVKTDDWATGFKAGSCHEVGTAER